MNAQTSDSFTLHLSPPAQWRVLASNTIKNLIKRMTKNNRAARAARTYEQVRTVLCKTTT